MTDQRQALLQAILDNPADDQLRLVYADWLEEHGEEARAEFIRLQCKIVEIDKELMDDTDCEYQGCSACAERNALRHREQKLLEANWEKWCWNRGVEVEVFRRGFVAEITLSSAYWFTHHKAILAEHPVEVVRLMDWPKVNYGPYREHHVIYFDKFWDSKMIVRNRDTFSVALPEMAAEKLLAHNWPHITFHLPDHPAE